MKILQLVHQYRPEFVGGTELYTQQLSERLGERGHQLGIYYRRPGYGLQKRLEKAGLTVWSGGAGAMSPAGRFRATFGQQDLHNGWLSTLNEFQPDLVHVQHLMGLPTSLMTELDERDIPYLITLHDYWWGCANAQLYTNYDQTNCQGPDRYINCGRCSLARGGLNGLTVLAPLVAPLLARRNQRLAPILAGARTVIAPTPFVKERYEQMGLEAAIEIVPHGIAVPAELPPRLPRGEKLRLIYLGSLAPQKGVHVAIAAVNALPAESVEFTIYGGLDTFPDYVAGLRQMATHPGIRFAGRIDRDAIWEPIAAADVALLPTLWYEASPLTIDEFFAGGLPIIGSQLGALPDKIMPNKDGLLVPPGDVAAWTRALQRLLAEPALLPFLRDGIRPVRTMRQHVDAMELIYQRVLAAG